MVRRRVGRTICLGIRGTQRVARGRQPGAGALDRMDFRAVFSPVSRIGHGDTRRRDVMPCRGTELVLVAEPGAASAARERSNGNGVGRGLLALGWWCRHRL